MKPYLSIGDVVAYQYKCAPNEEVFDSDVGMVTRVRMLRPFCETEHPYVVTVAWSRGQIFKLRCDESSIYSTSETFIIWLVSRA